MINRFMCYLRNQFTTGGIDNNYRGILLKVVFNGDLTLVDKRLNNLKSNTAAAT